MYWIGRKNNEKVTCVYMTQGNHEIKIVEINQNQITRENKDLLILSNRLNATKLCQVLQRYDGIEMEVNSL